MSASWYNANWRYRVPIAVNNIGGASANFDVQASIPADFDLFWDNVLSSGNDIRVCTADGRTLATYDIAGLSVTNRVGTIEVQATQLDADATHLLWLYWGYASAADARTAFVPASAKTGTIRVERPKLIIPVERQRPGATKPATELQKAAAEALDLYWHMTPALTARDSAYNGRGEYEGVKSVTFDVQTGGVSQAALFDESLTYFVETRKGLYVKTRVKAGSSGTNYTTILTVTSTLARIIEGRCVLRVRNTSEA